jgi:hypothetical protein
MAKKTAKRTFEDLLVAICCGSTNEGRLGHAFDRDNASHVGFAE